MAWDNKKISVMPGDSIVVSRSTNTINVKGEVYNSGLIEYKEGKPLRYYLNKAGGIKNTGDRDGVMIIYPNGNVIPKDGIHIQELLKVVR